MKNGDKYIGYFTNGVLNGKGTCISSNGEKYIGYFESQQKEGKSRGFLWKSDGRCSQDSYKGLFNRR